MEYEWELYRDGLLRTVRVKQHLLNKENGDLIYDLIEFTMMSSLTDENGKLITNSNNTFFLTKQEFNSFFGPIVDKLKQEIDNGISNSIQE
jgi:hypothetical protein